MVRLKNILKIFSNLEAITDAKYGYITPPLVSKLAGINLRAASFILHVAEKSGYCKKIYLVRSKLPSKKLFGPWDFKDQIPQKIDPGTYNDEEFDVNEKMIEEAYKLVGARA